MQWESPHPSICSRIVFLYSSYLLLPIPNYYHSRKTLKKITDCLIFHSCANFRFLLVFFLQFLCTFWHSCSFLHENNYLSDPSPSNHLHVQKIIVYILFGGVGGARHLSVCGIRYLLSVASAPPAAPGWPSVTQSCLGRRRS